MSYENLNYQESEINRLTSNVAAIEALFPNSGNPTDEGPRATWGDRMGLVHRLDDQWNYIEQPEIPRIPRADLWARLNYIEHQVPLIPQPYLWAQVYQPPVPVAWYPDLEDRQIAIGAPRADRDDELGDDEDYTDSASDDGDSDSEFDYDWESDSGIESLSEASDTDSWDDSWSDASSNSSMRAPSPNAYLRRLEEFEDLQVYLYRDCPYCEWQRQYMYRIYQINERPRPHNYWGPR